MIFILKIHFYGASRELEHGIAAVAERLHIKPAQDGIPVRVLNDQQLTVKGESGVYTLGCSEKTEFFRGLTILIDRLKREETDFLITEKKRFETCGVMLDVSRNGVLTVATAKDLIERMALMGLNMLMLYMEDGYKMEKYPWFGYMRGAYSKIELKAIQAHASLFGIELIPCIQTLGHLSTVLRWKAADHILDTKDVLMIDEPETYELIEEMLKTCRECFSTARIHIGMDEAFGVGLGQYLERNGYVPAHELMTRHLKKVAALAAKYFEKPMMWSDMLFHIAGGKGGYYDADTSHFAQLSKDLPENIELVYWDYEGDEYERYHQMLSKHEQLQREVAFAGGIWTWNRMTVNLQKTYTATKSALAACASHGVKTIFATVWGNGGSMCPLYSVLPGLQLWAEYHYYSEADEKHLEERFQICCGYEWKTFQLLSVDSFDDAVRKKYQSPSCICINSSMQIFFQDILQGLMDKTLSGYEFKKHYAAYYEKLLAAKPQDDLQYLFDWLKLFLEIICRKSDIGLRLTRAYREKNRSGLLRICGELKKLAQDVETLHALHGEIWHYTYKPFGWDALDMRYAGLAARIHWAEHRTAQYLNSEIAAIEELEEERLYYNGEDMPLMETGGPTTFLSASVLT